MDGSLCSIERYDKIGFVLEMKTIFPGTHLSQITFGILRDIHFKNNHDSWCTYMELYHYRSN